MVSTCPHIFKSSNPCTNLLVTVLSMPFTTVITITFLFHSFFSPLARSRYLSLFAFFLFYLVVSQKVKVHYSASFLFLLLTISWSGGEAKIW